MLAKITFWLSTSPTLIPLCALCEYSFQWVHAGINFSTTYENFCCIHLQNMNGDEIDCGYYRAIFLVTNIYNNLMIIFYLHFTISCHQ